MLLFADKKKTICGPRPFQASRTLKAWKLTNGRHLILLSVYKDVLSRKSFFYFSQLDKVKDSQRMNDPAISTWIIASKEGTVLSVHCMDCKAGLAESCSLVASILFYIY